MYKSLQTVRPWVLAVACLAPAELDGAGRELTTDRPDATESPYTVAARRVQVEADAASFARDTAAGQRTETWEAGAFNVRLGLTARTELGLFVVPFRQVRESGPAGPAVTRRGAGDLTLRGKVNFFGNDTGTTAAGLIVDVKLPTGRRDFSNGAVEGAVILPVSGELGGGWEFGAMTGMELRARDTGRGRRGVWINTVTTGHDLTPAVAGYLELTSETGDGPHAATFDAGLTLKADEDLQYDVGVEIGLSRAADDLRIFAGVSRRF